VIDRFKQIAPKVLFAVDSYHYEVANSTTTTPLFGNSSRRAAPAHRIGARTSIRRPIQLVDALSGMRYNNDELVFERVPFSHPYGCYMLVGHNRLPRADRAGRNWHLLEHLESLQLT